ncbi:MAG: ATP-binding protein, partial [Cyclobacteriaceae bacterium]|nr:ATP-binding protein [Cyclobacteriaceae bacterium]
INHMIEDRDHRTWLATERFGLVELLRNAHGLSYKIHPILENPEAVLFLRAIIEDDRGYLWLSSDKGIFRYDKSSSTSEQFTMENGLQANQFSFGACIQTSDGTILFGGSKGYTYFNPMQIGENVLPQNVEITNFRIFDKEVPITPDGILQQNISETRDITLKYNQNTIGFEFSELDFTGTGHNSYCYMLEGFDQEWFTNRLETSVRYTNLSPGSYRFVVYPVQNNQCIKEKGSSLAITVLSPWWQKWWVRTSEFIMIALIVIGTIHFRIKTIKERNLRLEQTVANRTNELALQKEETEQKNSALQDTLNHLKQTQSKLVQSEKLASLGVLTAGIAHEINNPINFINGSINAIDDNIKDLQAFDTIMNESWEKIITATKNGDIQDNKNLIDELNNLRIQEKDKIQYDFLVREQAKLLKTIHNGIERTSTIIKGLQIFSHNEEKKFQSYEIHKIIESSITLLLHKHKNRIEMIREYTNNQMVDCMPGKISQVIVNILDNAIHSIQKNGKITIKTTRMENDNFQISISDTGKGIPKEVQSKIFDPFFTTKDVGTGTGLGLSISKGIMDSHHATIQFETSDQGTTFFIQMPIHQKNDSLAEA